MRALVISGGGSKGAFAGGIAEYLITQERRSYDIFVGTSTGSLLVPLLSLGKIEKLKQVYTNVRQEDIFNINPFAIKKRKNGTTKVSINHFNTLLMFLRGKKTFGESKNLRKLIEKTLTEEEFKTIRQSKKKIIVTVSNLTRNIVEYKYANDCSYQDFCDWIWISSNLTPFMSLVVKNKYEYADGGFGNLVPIQEAINMGAKVIDVIVLNPRQRNIFKPRSRNAFNLLTSALDFMLTQIGRDDIFIGLMESRYTDVEVNFFHTPRKLTENSFVFQPHEMSSWWQEGYEFAKTMVSMTHSNSK